MAFWGVELKPGKPYVHKYDDEHGRLHLSQATIGSGSSNQRTTVQCVVGDNKPISICTLLPGRVENCALNLEFEEEGEVTFTTIGPHSVHLSGFFYGPDEDGDACNLDHYEGDDVGSESESDDLDYDSEDEDKDDFIDDDDVDMYPSSPVPNSGVTIEEILDDEEPTKENTTSKKSKKKKNQKGELNKDKSGKQLVVRGTSGAPLLTSEDEDEDGLPIPPSRKSSDVTKKDHSGVDSHQKDKDATGMNLKRKIDGDDQDGDTLRETSNGATPGNDSKKKKRNKKKKLDTKDDAKAEFEINGKDGSEADPSHIDEAPVADMKNALKSATKEEKKKKKRKKKNEKAVASDGDTPAKNNVSSLDSGEKSKAKIRTFPNGLVIEELAMGKPDGKKASPGRKVSVHYIGKLQKNGKIFDSNIGKAPFQFRLGIGQVIKGWDVGVNGMRVGDKRRLHIPPDMGYGSKGAGGAIPPNAWLDFDVELVNVN